MDDQIEAIAWQVLTRADASTVTKRIVRARVAEALPAADESLLKKTVDSVIGRWAAGEAPPVQLEASLDLELGLEPAADAAESERAEQSQPQSQQTADESSDEELVVSQASQETRKRKAEPEEAGGERATRVKHEGQPAGGIQRDAKGEQFISLGPEHRKVCKRVTVSQFRRETYVSVREFYRESEDGEWKHGRKGIALPVHLWKQLLSLEASVDAMIEQL